MPWTSKTAAPEHRKLLKAVRAFESYIRANRASIPNYGERYRKGQIISTAFVESAVNQVGEQTVCEETADAVDARWGSPLAANPGRSAQRGLARHAVALVGRIERTCRGEGGLASGFYWSHDAPAYLMYPSGAAGPPKGVIMPHRALVNLLLWHERALPRPARHRPCR